MSFNSEFCFKSERKQSHFLEVATAISLSQPPGRHNYTFSLTCTYNRILELKT